MTGEIPKRSPVFILGIMPRSGTNFLSNLLQLHPECVPTETVWEDYSVAHAHVLKKYSKEVTAHWDSDWGIGNETVESFHAALGAGIREFLHAGPGRHLTIAKTPSVRNLELFFQFFPESPLLVLVRDGRSVIESGIRSFGWRFEPALHWLRREARTVTDFVGRHPPQNQRYRIVHYEDLWRQPGEQMQDLLDFLRLDVETYDFEQAGRMPLRGSSELLEHNSKDLHWDPVERPQDFDPLHRYRHWSGFMNYRYQRVAGSTMAALGYPPAHDGEAPFSWKVRNLALDVTWWISQPFRALFRKLRGKTR